ncbi:hypothetical protein Tco_1209288 [Tanacetum coccineum]
MTSTAAQQVALDNALVAPENRFKLDTKKCAIDVEVFRDILQICPRLPNQEFDAPPLDEEVITFIKELGPKGDIKSVSEVVVDQMHQPWRTFATIVNRCLFGKTSGLDKIRLSRAQILWGMYYNKNVDFVELLWKDFVFQIDNRDAKKQEKMYYPKFTKAIIHHFISKDNLISIRNKIFMHTVRDDRAAIPKKARKFKKPTYPSKKKALVVVEELVEKHVKKPATRRQSAGVQIRDTPGVSMSKKKAATKAERSKWVELLSEAASLEEAQLKKAIKRSKRETNIHQAGVPDVSKANYSESEYESWGDSDDEEDEFVHTPDDYVPTDDKNVDDEEYECVNKEMYDDVNEVSQEVACDQVKDDAQETIMASPATQKTEVSLQSSSISSDYATKFHNFDNIPLGGTKIISMMDIKVQHKDPTPATTIPPPIPPFISLQQQSTLIPTPTTTEATTSTIAIPDFETLSAIHLRVSDLEKEVKTLKNVDYSSAIRSAIRSKVSTVVKEYLGTNLDDTLYKKPQKSVADIHKIKIEHAAKQQESQYTSKSSNKAALKEFD